MYHIKLVSPSALKTQAFAFDLFLPYCLMLPPGGSYVGLWQCIVLPPGDIHRKTAIPLPHYHHGLSKVSIISKAVPNHTLV